MLYKSNVFPTIEDVAFEGCYWVEEDMRGVLDRVLEGETYVAVRGGLQRLRPRAARGKRRGKQ